MFAACPTSPRKRARGPQTTADEPVGTSNRSHLARMVEASQPPQSPSPRTASASPISSAAAGHRRRAVRRNTPDDELEVHSGTSTHSTGRTDLHGEETDTRATAYPSRTQTSRAAACAGVWTRTDPPRVTTSANSSMPAGSRCTTEVPGSRAPGCSRHQLAVAPDSLRGRPVVDQPGLVEHEDAVELGEEV